MIENIVRYIEAGEPAFEAAIKGAGQIGFTIISITFSLIAVFIPLLFMSGIIGRLFHEFAMTVSIAVVASAFIALTLTPMMCSLFLAREHDRPPGRINRAFERLFDWMLAGYDRGLNWVFRHQLLTLAFDHRADRPDGISLLRHPKGFHPASRIPALCSAHIEARQDTSFAANHEVAGSGLEDHPARSGRCRHRQLRRRNRRQCRARTRPACSFSSSRSGNGRRSNR